MLGAIIGDVVGSVYEFDNHRSKVFELVTQRSHFTDDTVLTVALMDCILHTEKIDADSVSKYFQSWGRRHPHYGFGGRFYNEWLWEDSPRPYRSFGNGSAMRISPIAYVAKSKEELLELSDIVTGVTHNHPEGLKGARSVALATYMALHGASREEIYDMAVSYYPEIKGFEYNDLVKHYYFNETSQNTCPQALYCFLISKDFEDCLRTSVSIGGDTDTLCAMSCAIAEAFYKEIPEKLVSDVFNKLNEPIKKVVTEFREKYGGK